MTRWAWAEVDLDAISRNVRAVRAIVRPSDVWAVVKADAYGHGAVETARAARAGGATGLCVALGQEGVELRRAGLAGPILVLSDEPAEALDEALEADLTLTVYTLAAIEDLARCVRRRNHGTATVHVKVDTGMHRVGCRPAELNELCSVITAAPELSLGGVYTHCAVADSPSNPYTEVQLDTFDTAIKTLPRRPALVHAANSAAALAHPRSRLDLVRLGIAMYGLNPSDEVEAASFGLRPALSLHARVSFVKRIPAGAAVSYGLTERVDRDTTIATVPIGYADGVPRQLSARGGEVLLGGKRRRILGRITMDQLMIDCADDVVHVGDPVVLLGEQNGERITADEWAALCATIGYEIVCGISRRIRRRYTTGT